jgi:hypothetical protein
LEFILKKEDDEYGRFKKKQLSELGLFIIFEINIVYYDLGKLKRKDELIENEDGVNNNVSLSSSSDSNVENNMNLKTKFVKNSDKFKDE